MTITVNNQHGEFTISEEAFYNLISNYKPEENTLPEDPSVEPPTKINFVLPTIFTSPAYTIDPLISKCGDKWSSEYDFHALIPNRANTYYVDPVSGVDTNVGTQALPFKSVYTALNKTGENKIVCAAGHYTWKDGPRGFNPERSVSVVCESGMAVFTNDCVKKTWTADPSYPGMYRGLVLENGETWTPETVRFYINHDPENCQSLGTLIPIIPTADVLAGQVGVSVGSTNIVLRLPNGLAPDYNNGFAVKMVKDNLKLSIPAAGVTYLKNIVATHGLESALKAVSTTGTIVTENCKFLFGLSGNSATFQGFSKIINKGSEASSGYLDGFNYHMYSDFQGACSILEIDCIAHDNGKVSNGINNGTTVHDHLKIIRLNGDYSRNQDRNVHDVGQGAAINIGCCAFDSKTGDVSFGVGHPTVAGNLRSWMIDCKTDKIGVYASSTLNLDSGTEYENLSNAGTVVPYTV